METIAQIASKPELQPLHESLGFLINGLARLMRNALEAKLEGTGLTATQWTVLMALGEVNGQSQTDLSRQIFLDNATITRTLDLLEAKGMIERTRGDADRRIQFVTLTNLGISTWQKTAHFGVEVNNAATPSLGHYERLDLERMLRTVLREMSTRLGWGFFRDR